jgi:gamma-butyrobetaine dioxygenase
MSPEEVRRFEREPWFRSAVAVRRWDDAAKDPAATPPAFGYYKPMLRRLLRDQASGAALRPGSPPG